MDDELLKLECLKLCGGDVNEAQKRFDWIKGRNQGDGLKAIDPKAPQARVVGRDGDSDFKDYIK